MWRPAGAATTWNFGIPWHRSFEKKAFVTGNAIQLYVKPAQYPLQASASGSTEMITRSAILVPAGVLLGSKRLCIFPFYGSYISNFRMISYRKIRIANIEVPTNARCSTHIHLLFTPKRKSKRFLDTFQSIDSAVSEAITRMWAPASQPLCRFLLSGDGRADSPRFGSKWQVRPD